MSFSSHDVSKLDYARYLAASLAYLSLRQSDAVGLLTFDSGIKDFVPPRRRHGQLLSILRKLEDLDCTGDTDIRAALEQLSKMVRRRSLVVLISDFYQQPSDLAKAFRFFHHRGNEVLAFHVLDPQELEMSLEGVVTLEDIETGEQIPYTAEVSRSRYLKELESHITRLRRECRNVQIDHVLLNSSLPLDRGLLGYLSLRTRRI
jgi:uncharacterized protein (DUF58 family)